MQLQTKILIGAGAAAAIGLTAACTVASEQPEDSIGAAQAETSTESAFADALRIVRDSGRSENEAIELLHAAGRTTAADSGMLDALRMGVASSRSSTDVSRILSAADRVTTSDSTMLQLARIGDAARATVDEVEAVFQEIDGYTSTDRDAVAAAAARLPRATPAPAHGPV